MDLSDLRREYSRTGLRRADLDADPIRQFETWFGQAQDAKLTDASAFSLATASADGKPAVRTVLLKIFDAAGFVFFTNFGSTKAKQIAENARVSMLFHWLPLERQVIIEGTASRVDRAQALAYFATRPRGSQLGAWVSAQSSVISGRAWLEAQLGEAIQTLAGGEVPMPTQWGGYRVHPGSIEFWQGRENRLHDRLRYVRSDADATGWTLERLAP